MSWQRKELGLESELRPELPDGADLVFPRISGSEPLASIAVAITRAASKGSTVKAPTTGLIAEQADLSVKVSCRGSFTGDSA
jgi:hypothetical protein